MKSTVFRPVLLILLLSAMASTPQTACAQTVIDADLLICGGDESACAAAVQAARMGVKRIVMVSDIDWLGGQFCTQGIGPVDEWTLVNGRQVNFPRSGAFLEIIRRIRNHNRSVYGVATPGNSWCGTETIEPQAAAAIFEDWLSPYTIDGSNQLQIQRPWIPQSVQADSGRVTGVTFCKEDDASKTVTVNAKLTVDSTDWGDVIRLSGAEYMCGPDLKSRFHEPSAPESLEDGGHQEMNPLSWCVLLREAGGDSTIPKPGRFDLHSFSDWKSAPPWRDWDGSGGIYNSAGWCFYTHRRMVDRYHHNLPVGTEATILNWPAHDYPLSTLPKHVCDKLERDETGASQKNIVNMTPAQRRIVYSDAKQRTLEFLYFLQTSVHDRVGDFPQSFRYMKLADDYGTADQLPPKPYIREGLRLEAMYVMREQDVRTENKTPLWAKKMVSDGVFGWQFNLDFHPTRRIFKDGNNAQPWQGKHYGTRNWSTHTDRAMFPLRSLIPEKMNGLLGCSKNIGVSSMVQSAVRLHGQMMHVGTAVGTVASMSLNENVSPRAIASSPDFVTKLQTVLVRGVGGPGTLIWPWHDVAPDDDWFEAVNILTIAGIWKADADSVHFSPQKAVTHLELQAALERLSGSRITVADDANDSLATWGTLNKWLKRSELPEFTTLTAAQHAQRTLTRADCVDYLYRVYQKRK